MSKQAFFSAEKLFYGKIPAKVQSRDLAVSVGFWASTPAGIWSCLVCVRAYLVAKVRSLLLVGSVLGPVMLLGWTVGADPNARRSVCCLELIMRWFHEGGVLSKRASPSPFTVPSGLGRWTTQDSPTAPPLARGVCRRATPCSSSGRDGMGASQVHPLVLARIWKEANIRLPGAVEHARVHGKPRGKRSSLGADPASNRTRGLTGGRCKGRFKGTV